MTTMVHIKLLDKPPFYYHQYERVLKPKMETVREGVEEVVRDEFGYVVYEGPDSDWCLPYEPAYITTDEQWLADRIRAYAATAGEMVDIISDATGTFTCSIPQERLDLCIPPEERKHNNVPAVIPPTRSLGVKTTSDGRQYYLGTQSSVS